MDNALSPTAVQAVSGDFGSLSQLPEQQQPGYGELQAFSGNTGLTSNLQSETHDNSSAGLGEAHIPFVPQAEVLPMYRGAPQITQESKTPPRVIDPRQGRCQPSSSIGSPTFQTTTPRRLKVSNLIQKKEAFIEER